MNYHLFSYMFPRSVDEFKRNSNAQSTWLGHQMAGNCKLVPYYLGGWPSVDEMINSTILNLRDIDKIVITNLDSYLATDAYNFIDTQEIGFSRRRDFNYALYGAYYNSLDGELFGGQPFHGIDLVWFTKSWWMANRDTYPKLFICADCWDWVFRFMIGDQRATPAEIVFHQNHKPNREKYFRYRVPEFVHNRRVTKEWFESLDDGDTKEEIKKNWNMEWYGREIELLEIINATGTNPEEQVYD